MSEGKGVKFLRFLAEHGLLITLGLGLLVRIYLLFVREYVIVNDGQAEIDKQLKKIIVQCNKPF